MSASPSPIGYNEDAMPPPAPMRREPPAGPDPYEEDRLKARAEAAAGARCPTNQHGCYYFSKSEWIFCPMCEWLKGRAEGLAAGDGKLTMWGGTRQAYEDELEAGYTIRVGLADINAIFLKLKTFLGLLAGWDWDNLSPKGTPIELTLTQLHNLLMVYGAPTGCLTAEVWEGLQRQYPL
jgi:hypothetical protein